MSTDSPGDVDGVPRGEPLINLQDIVFEKKIGKGAFGEVFKACYLGTDVAVKKMLQPEDRWIRKLIKREIEALRAVRHPNVVNFMGICKAGTDIYVITEYVEGGTLWKLVKNKSKPLTWLVRTSFALDVSKAIAYLHARNIIHRDLKCKNLLVEKSTHVKVCDFGLSRDTGENEQKFMTKAGTDRWMAPEVILGNPYNIKADAFSFGMALYELIVRAKPPERRPSNGYQFEPNELMELVPPDCPPELRQLLCDCSDHDQNLRPNFMDILNRLKECKARLMKEQKDAKSSKLKAAEAAAAVPPPPLHRLPTHHMSPGGILFGEENHSLFSETPVPDDKIEKKARRRSMGFKGKRLTPAPADFLAAIASPVTNTSGAEVSPPTLPTDTLPPPPALELPPTPTLAPNFPPPDVPISPSTDKKKRRKSDNKLASSAVQSRLINPQLKAEIVGVGKGKLRSVKAKVGADVDGAAHPPPLELIPPPYLTIVPPASSPSISPNVSPLIAPPRPFAEGVPPPLHFDQGPLPPPPLDDEPSSPKPKKKKELKKSEKKTPSKNTL